MKTILVPTDFSKIARNAIDYAVEIAKLTKARLILFHVYHATVVPSEMPIVLPTGEIEKEALDGLKKIGNPQISRGIHDPRRIKNKN